jgi:hypothetical protein
MCRSEITRPDLGSRPHRRRTRLERNLRQGRTVNAAWKDLLARGGDRHPTPPALSPRLRLGQVSEECQRPLLPARDASRPSRRENGARRRRVGDLPVADRSGKFAGRSAVPAHIGAAQHLWLPAGRMRTNLDRHPSRSDLGYGHVAKIRWWFPACLSAPTVVGCSTVMSGVMPVPWIDFPAGV